MANPPLDARGLHVCNETFVRYDFDDAIFDKDTVLCCNTFIDCNMEPTVLHVDGETIVLYPSIDGWVACIDGGAILARDVQGYAPHVIEFIKAHDVVHKFDVDQMKGRLA